LDRTPFAYSLFCFKIDILKLEVMGMHSKNNSIQQDQLEMITLDQLVPANHLVRKIEASIDCTFLYDLVKDMYSEVGSPSIDPVILKNFKRGSEFFNSEPLLSTN
jgi:hypothetical protein